MEGPVVSKSGCALKSSCELWVGAGWGRGRNKQNSPTPRPNFQKSCTARGATAFVYRSGIPGMRRGSASGGDSVRGQARAVARPEDSKESLGVEAYFKIDSANTEHSTWRPILQ